MKQIQLTAALLCFALLGAAGADQDGQADTQTAMQAIRFAGWEKILQEQPGKITVVDLWASWCAPCIERFPHMVDLHHRYNNEGVRFISLNFDQQGDLESLEWANNFLHRVGAVFPNYHMDENMSQAFERLDLLGLPVVLIYDRDGAEAYRLTGDDPNKQFGEEDVERAIQSLLEKTPALQINAGHLPQ